jgi:DNA-binding transcriptional MerR regulator
MASVRLTVEEVVKRLGVTPRTLHYYEEFGLIAPCDRTSGGHRVYDEEVVRKLEHILRMKDNMGYSLHDIRGILEAEEALDSLRAQYRADGATERERERVLEESIRLLESIVRQIDEKLANLTRMRDNFEGRLERARHSRQAAGIASQGSGRER